ncbi:hypothetical protein ACFL6S_20170 [Candidatus Poribacteria bacterium]
MGKIICSLISILSLAVFVSVLAGADSGKLGNDQETSMSKPREAVLMNSFSIEPFGGDVLEIADLNGDGELEMLTLQTAGQFCSKVYSNRTDLDEVDRTLHCLTAVTWDGEILWQDGVPYNRDMPFTGHGAQAGNMMLAVGDIDSDGKPEVMVIRHGELAILDPETGKTKRSVALPSDNYIKIYTAQLGPPEKGRQIICRVNDTSYKPWGYANPNIVYNADLSVYHEPFSVRGAGHNLVVMDINGDGRDELFIGYSLLDHECNAIWSVDAKEHADHIGVSDLNDDGKLEVRYAGSKDFFVTDLSGKILWESSAGHSQTSMEGPWGSNGEKLIIMCEKNRGLWGMDTTGNVLWNNKNINGYAVADVKWSRDGVRRSWALFRPQLKTIKPTPYESDPAWSTTLWPRFLDGDGTLIDVFPWKDDYVQPKRLIRAERSYDCGVKYYPMTSDIDGDGLDEVIIYDRSQVWVFRSPE